MLQVLQIYGLCEEEVSRCHGGTLNNFSCDSNDRNLFRLSELYYSFFLVFVLINANISGMTDLIKFRKKYNVIEKNIP